MANPDYYPFLYGATAHFPPRKFGKSASVLIDIAQHPIIFSRAVCTMRPDEKLSANDEYLRETRQICEETCPIRNCAQMNVTCKRMSYINALAESIDHSELGVKEWAEILKCGLCKPSIY
jgi:hypothetical protein